MIATAYEITSERLTELRTITNEDYYNDDLESALDILWNRMTAYDFIVDYQKALQALKCHTDETPQSIKDDWEHQKSLLWVGVEMIDRYYQGKPDQAAASIALAVKSPKPYQTIGSSKHCARN